MTKRTSALGLGAVLLVLLAFAVPASAAALWSRGAGNASDDCPGCQYACNDICSGDLDQTRDQLRDGSCATTLVATGDGDQTRDRLRLQDGTGENCRK
ncbi:MAG TPA: hypothetical protein PLG75_10470 [Methanoculleus sp.]|nr:hypothetical protein [Methanoculleus sp.]